MPLQREIKSPKQIDVDLPYREQKHIPYQPALLFEDDDFPSPGGILF